MAHVQFTSATYLIESPFFLIKDYCLRGKLYWTYIHSPCKLSHSTEVVNLNGSCFRQLKFKEKLNSLATSGVGGAIEDSVSDSTNGRGDFSCSRGHLSKSQLSLEKRLMSCLKVLRSPGSWNCWWPLEMRRRWPLGSEKWRCQRGKWLLWKGTGMWCVQGRGRRRGLGRNTPCAPGRGTWWRWRTGRMQSQRMSRQELGKQLRLELPFPPSCPFAWGGF